MNINLNQILFEVRQNMSELIHLTVNTHIGRSKAGTKDHQQQPWTLVDKFIYMEVTECEGNYIKWLRVIWRENIYLEAVREMSRVCLAVKSLWPE